MKEMNNKKKFVLVIGGSGYIGSHIYLSLKEYGYEPFIIDNFSNSYLEVINNLKLITGEKVFYEKIDVRNSKLISKILKKYQIRNIIHLAAHKSIEESVLRPNKYLIDNPHLLISALSALKGLDECNFLFSSSANVYRFSKEGKLAEGDAQGSNNAYGKSKIICEYIIKQFFKKNNNFKYSILRYFNPAGAHSSGFIGQNEKSIFKNLFSKIDDVALQKEKELEIYVHSNDVGENICIRDFFHVMDLADGHVKSLMYINEEKKNLLINLGSGTGMSVIDVVKNYEKFNNIKIPFSLLKKKNKDLPYVVPSISLAKRLINWSPKYSIRDICKTSYKYAIKNY